MKEQKQKRITIIGGGAAGFFTAINLAKFNKTFAITIVEKTGKVLSKVKVSGGGRCNVTHACFDNRELVENYPRGMKELLGPFHSFSTSDTIAWFEERGVEVVMEEDGRMFPKSNTSQTIIDCFMNEINKYQIQVMLNEEVIEVNRTEGFELLLKSGKKLKSDKVVVSTGGNQKLKHYNFLAKMGVKIVPPVPSLFTFNLPKHPSNKLMGLAINALVSIPGTKFEEYGPVLFTHWGMSGPAILKLSSKAAIYLYNKSYQFNYLVEWVENGKSFIEEMREKNAKNKVATTKIDSIPSRMWTYLLQRAGVNEKKNWGDLNRQNIENLIKVLEEDDYYANGKTTFKEEFVSCGGVDLREINMKTMESKKVRELYMVGELINIDALTGGFNFQAAWTTGYIAAKAIAEQN